MSAINSNPQALQIIESRERSFKLKIKEIEQVLNAADIRDRHVVVVSVVGALRQGKSFLLNFFLRYLLAQYKRNDVKSFLKQDIGKDFSWRGGSKSDTSGIWIWSEIFTHDYKNGDKVAIILMDTEGLFDYGSSVRDSSMIFALSAVMSSVLCYNVMQNVNEDNLQYLHLFAEYGKLLLDESDEKPFQMLLFVVRDWRFPYEHEYGWVGGNEVVNDRLKKDDQQGADAKKLRDQLRSSFEHIRGFLMPHPGLIVADDQKFSGKLSEINRKFLDKLNDLIPVILSPENLIVKQINGQKMRAKDFVQYLKSYMTIFDGDEIPEPKSIFGATADSYNLITYLDAKAKYSETMQTKIHEKYPYYSADILQVIHAEYKKESVTMFKNRPKLGGAKTADKYLQKLEDDIEQELNVMKVMNEQKKKKYLEELEKKMSTTAQEVIAAYKEQLKTLADLNMSNLITNQARIKKEALTSFQLKIERKDNDLYEKFISQLERDLEHEFISIKLQKKEKENAALAKDMETQKARDRLEMQSLLEALQQPAGQYSPAPSFCDSPSYAWQSSTPRYSPSPSSFSSSSSSPRVNYTSTENQRLATLFTTHGNDYNRVAREFNNSRSTSTPRSAKQIQSKFYRMRRNGDID